MFRARAAAWVERLCSARRRASARKAVSYLRRLSGFGVSFMTWERYHPVLSRLTRPPQVYRVTSDPANDPRGKTGGYWTRTPPTNLNEVIGGTAVMPEWNNFQRVYEFTAPPYADPVKQEPKFHVWEGLTDAQPVSNLYKEKKDDGYHLPGGESQVFISNHLAWDPAFPNHITDITPIHKVW